ncbi:SMP-30/gluconolactonase/LRE family protein [Amycolatopsis deserti]|uniref:SMP-30/gluconolactonase/LRE family protein n=1 Tax=Amycolatopsis deserti TaxID=185696 RepID=UPI001E59CCCB|nr:SMP-30/gluconolactonase/LRE family protein [Amycolatopsis deserti]
MGSDREHQLTIDLDAPIPGAEIFDALLAPHCPLRPLPLAASLQVEHRHPLQRRRRAAGLPSPEWTVCSAADGGWIAAAGRGIAILDDGVRWLARVVPESMRMNDGVADGSGRFWAGAMAWDARPDHLHSISAS